MNVFLVHLLHYWNLWDTMKFGIITNELYCVPMVLRKY